MARFALAAVLELARLKLESAEQRLAQSRQRWQAAQAKLAQLDQYREDYGVQLSTQQRQGMDAYRQRDFLAFLAKLDLARRQQSEEVARCKQAWDQGFQVWTQLRQEHEAMLALRARHLRAERSAESRREQKLQDEFAARAGRNLPEDGSTEGV